MEVATIEHVSPRPSPTRHDQTAVRYLTAASILIDSVLSEGDFSSRRLSHLHYPAALEWIRIEDVVAVARQNNKTPVSKKALTTRWSSKDGFIQDAVLYAMLYHDDETRDPSYQAPRMDRVRNGLFSSSVTQMADELSQGLLNDPRSFLLAHIAPLFPRHHDLAAAVASSADNVHRQWISEYPVMLEHLGCTFRSDWPAERITLSLQMMLDGLVVRYRVNPELIQSSNWEGASIFADTVIAFLNGVLDIQGDGLSGRAWLDHRLEGRT